MEYRKNDIVTLKIEDCGIDGEGIGKADGFTVFVKDAVIGDTVRAKIMKAKKNYGYGRLEEIITPSPTVWSRSVSSQDNAEVASCRPFLMRSSWNLRLPKSGDIWSGLAALQIFLWRKSWEWTSLSTIEIKHSFQLERQKTAELLPDFMPAVHTVLLRTGTVLLG